MTAGQAAFQVVGLVVGHDVGFDVGVVVGLLVGGGVGLLVGGGVGLLVGGGGGGVGLLVGGGGGGGRGLPPRLGPDASTGVRTKAPHEITAAAISPGSSRRDRRFVFCITISEKSQDQPLSRSSPNGRCLQRTGGFCLRPPEGRMKCEPEFLIQVPILENPADGRGRLGGDDANAER
jgi:hypothetical protein